MASTIPTVINIYFEYWQQHIRPIKEERIRAQFDEVLIDVGHRLYGVEFGLELAFLFLKTDNADAVGERVFD